MLPIIPLILVNGSKGIGTGFSTNISNHNPSDIINYIKDCLGKTPMRIRPYYSGFKGTIDTFLIQNILLKEHMMLLYKK